jgi:hypothetical protein
LLWCCNALLAMVELGSASCLAALNCSTTGGKVMKQRAWSH